MENIINELLYWGKGAVLLLVIYFVLRIVLNKMEKEAIDMIVKDVQRNTVRNQQGYVVRDRYTITLSNPQSGQDVVIENVRVSLAKGRKVKVNVSSGYPKILSVCNNQLRKTPVLDVCHIVLVVCILFVLGLVTNLANAMEFYIVSKICIPGFCLAITYLIEKGFFIKEIKHYDMTLTKGKVVDIAVLRRSKEYSASKVYYPVIEYEWLGSKTYGYLHQKISPSRSLINKEYDIKIDSRTGELLEEKPKLKYIYLICKILFVLILIASVANCI